MTEHLPVSELGEMPPDITIKKPPAIDLFLAGMNNDPLLSPAIVENPLLLNEAKERRQLYDSLGYIFEAVPDGTVSMREALKMGLITEPELISLYDQLSSFLSEPTHYRLVLYLPFQLLPENFHNSKRSSLSLSEKRFTEFYLNAWKYLFAGENDVRTNYTDGDILEPELKRGQTPIVRKAAHLLPELVRRNLVDISIIQRVLDRSDDPILIQSTLETYPILIDNGHLQKDSLTKLFTSPNEMLRKSAMSINEQYTLRRKQLAEDQKTAFVETSGLSSFFASFQKSIETIEKKFFIDHQYPPETPRARLDWDKQLAIQKSIERHAEIISRSLNSGKLKYESIRSYMLKPEEATLSRLVCVTGTFYTLERLSQINKKSTHGLSEQFIADLRLLSRSQPDSIREAIETGLYHMRNLGLIYDDTLQSFNISIPSFDSVLPAGLENQETRKNLHNLAKTISELKHDDLWMKYLYPIILVNGSRIKGYARKDADFDTCVFIRPSVPWEQRNAVLKVINEKLDQFKNVGKVVEFWLDESSEGYTIKNVPFKAPTVARSDWGYVLLGSVWIGDTLDTKYLSRDLISWYLRGGHTKSNPNHYSRRESLNQIERDVILYRLAQKGWQRFYPHYNYTKPELSSFIDADSAFWDPLFRRTASRLFVQKVFYPDISR